MIKFTNVTKMYRKGRVHALNNVSLFIGRGEFVYVIGPTGAGKTTMVKLLMRFYDINTGEILIDGHNVKDFNRHAKTGVSTEYVSAVKEVTSFIKEATGLVHDDAEAVLKDLNSARKHLAGNTNVGDEAEIEVNFSRSNHEGDIIDQIHQAHFDKFDGIVINAGAFTHYSYAIHDAISGIPVPTVEVHLSAIHQREEFRHKSVIAQACIGQISGFGKESYILGILALQNR